MTLVVVISQLKIQLKRAITAFERDRGRESATPQGDVADIRFPLPQKPKQILVMPISIYLNCLEAIRFTQEFSAIHFLQ